VAHRAADSGRGACERARARTTRRSVAGRRRHLEPWRIRASQFSL